MLAVSCVCHKDKYVDFSGYAQGGTYRVKINLKGVQARPREIQQTIDSILQNIDNSLSGYNKNSLLSCFNRGEAITPDELFVDVYSKAYDVYDYTGGVVDASAAALFDAWGFGFKSGEMPDERTIKDIMQNIGMSRLKRNMSEALGDDLVLSPDELLVIPGGVPARLNYNAIAQGYSCDLVASYLYSVGVKDMLVDIGEIYCDGVNASGNPWKLGIDRPVDGNNVLGADIQAIFEVPAGPHGVVTSGNYRKFYIRDGKKYAHTIDPRTGYPVTHNLLSATVVADDALTADAYATYCMAIGLEASKSLLEGSDDLEGCLVYDLDGEYHIWCSDGFALIDPE